MTDRTHAPAPAPLDRAGRLEALDILRGTALLGMILVHFHQRMRLEAKGLEDLVAWGVWILVEQKAWATFAFLFGAGFAIFLRRLEARGAPVVAIYLRRLAGLAAFGVIAEVFLGFHILLEYAGLGLVLFLVRGGSTKALLATAAVAACAGSVVTELTAWLASPEAAASSVTTRRALEAAVAAAAEQGSYGALVAARWARFVGMLPRTPQALIPDVNLTLFILGLLAVRHRILDEPKAHVRAIAGWMAFGFASWAASWLVLQRLEPFPVPAANWPIQYGFGIVQDQWLCLTYVGAVVLLLAFRPAWTARLAPVGLAGRMALTNYMLQAAVLDLLGSGYGFGMKLRPYGYTMAAGILFAFEATFSRAWLGRFRFGPLEWVWRSLTYARRQTLRRGAEAEAEAAGEVGEAAAALPPDPRGAEVPAAP